jgi:hypothetical protein
MHDGDDLINNNVAYGIVHLSSAGIADMGHAEQQPYDDISYALSDSENTVSRSNSAPDGSQSDAGPAVSLHVPRASLSAVASFEVGGLASSEAGGVELAAPIEDLNGNITFEVLAFQGSKYKMWDEPIDNFEITEAGSNDPPAVITLAYNDEDIKGLIEDNLTLYRFDGINWEPAACGDHEIIRFPKDNYISVPVCKTGVFTLSDKLPPPALKDRIYLPLI